MKHKNGRDRYYGGDMYISIPIPIPNCKSRGFSIPIPIPSQCEDFPSKRGRVQAIPTGAGLFAISRLNAYLKHSLNLLFLCCRLVPLFSSYSVFFLSPIWLSRRSGYLSIRLRFLSQFNSVRGKQLMM